MATSLDTLSNRFYLSSVDTICFGKEELLTSKLDRELYVRIHKAVQSVLLENSQFQRDLSFSKTREFVLHWNRGVLSYRIGDGEWKQLPSNQKLLSIFSSSIKELHDLYNEQVSPLRKVRSIDWKSPELQQSARRIEKVKERIQRNRNLDGTEKNSSVKKSVVRRMIGPFFDTFSSKKHIYYSIFGDKGTTASICLGYASVPVDFISGCLVEKSGKKVWDEAVKFEDAEGIRNGKALYYQGKLLKYGSVALGASLVTELIADKVLTGSLASCVAVAGTVLGTGGLIAVLGYFLGSAGYTGYNAFQCMKFRTCLNQRLNHPGEEHERQRIALEYLQELLVPKDEDILRIIEGVKNDKSIPLEKEEEIIEKKIENLFISRVQYLIRRCGRKSVQQVIEKAPDLIKKLQSENREN